MKVKVPDYFKDFKCIASECEDTCCANWSIVIDEETNSFYQSVKGDFGKILRSKIVKDENGDNIFVMNNCNCSFLNDKKMCDIYTNLGEEHLCYTCRQYPRYTEEFLDLKEQGISLSCPEAARIILRDSRKIKFDIKDVENTYEIEDDTDKEILHDFFSTREILFDIIETKNIDLNTKMALALNFIKMVQDKIDLGDMDEIKEVVNLYKDINFRDNTIKKLKNRKSVFNSHKKLQEYFKVYKDLKHIYSENPLGIDSALIHLNNEDLYVSKREEFMKLYKEGLYKFENIFTYFIYRYFMKAIFDYDMSAKIKLSIISTLIIKHLCVVRFIENGNFTDDDIVDIAHMYSKDIEHSEENIENLQEIFETKKEFETKSVIDILISKI